MRSLPQPIGTAVERELARFSPVGPMPGIVAVWPEAVGPAIAANAWPARVSRDGTLWVNTSSSTWAFELSQCAAVLVERLAEHLGEHGPRDARFAVGPIPNRRVESASNAHRVSSPASDDLRAEGERIAAGIGASGLRRAVAEAVTAALARDAAPVADRPV